MKSGTGPLLVMEPPPDPAGIGAGTATGLLTRILVLTALILAISTCHYTMSLETPYVHDIMDRGYYIPIALAAFWFGMKGSVTVGFAATLFYIPHIIQWVLGGGHHTVPEGAYGNKYVEAAIFPLFGAYFWRRATRFGAIASTLIGVGMNLMFLVWGLIIGGGPGAKKMLLVPQGFLLNLNGFLVSFIVAGVVFFGARSPSMNAILAPWSTARTFVMRTDRIVGFS